MTHLKLGLSVPCKYSGHNECNRLWCRCECHREGQKKMGEYS